ncbi:helix-turn-helix domain-containing protein [Streptomyces sp. NPDC046831]|uniref:helix-turn-helix domain-containing protein n=1 Tax=Streptomyces sp. NPDC046831 TaxID=3154805 RepID=UPI0033EC3613
MHPVPLSHRTPDRPGPHYLEAGDDTIARTGRRCGFSGSEHFSRSFRRIMGCTPSQYRTRRSCGLGQSLPVL